MMEIEDLLARFDRLRDGRLMGCDRDLVYWVMSERW